MCQHNVNYMIIGQDEMPQGIVSKSDLTGAISPYLQPMFSKWRRPLDDATLKIKVKWVMTRPVCTIPPEMSLSVIMENIRKLGGKCLPVTDFEGKVQGVVTTFEIFNALLKSEQEVSQAAPSIDISSYPALKTKPEPLPSQHIDL